MPDYFIRYTFWGGSGVFTWKTTARSKGYARAVLLRHAKKAGMEGTKVLSIEEILNHDNTTRGVSHRTY